MRGPRVGRVLPTGKHGFDICLTSGQPGVPCRAHRRAVRKASQVLLSSRKPRGHAALKVLSVFDRDLSASTTYDGGQAFDEVAPVRGSRRRFRWRLDAGCAAPTCHGAVSPAPSASSRLGRSAMIISENFDLQDLECLAWIAEGRSTRVPATAAERLLILGLVRKVDRLTEADAALELTTTGLSLIRSSDQ